MRVIIIIDPFERRLHAFDLPPVTANLIPGGLRVFAFRLNDSDALYAVEQLASEAGVSDDDIAKQAGNSEAVKKRVDKRKRKTCVGTLALKEASASTRAIYQKRWYKIGASQNVR
jgi:hypothetical protein